MAKELTKAQREVLVAIRDAAQNEIEAKAEAKRRGEELEAQLIAEAEKSTNLLVAKAKLDLKLSVTDIASLAFSTTNRHGTYRRLREAGVDTKARRPLITGGLPDALNSYRGRLDVETLGDESGATGYVLTLTDFTQEDVGSSLSGTVEYHPNGNEKSTDLKDADGVEVGFDPMIAINLWGLREVQEKI